MGGAGLLLGELSIDAPYQLGKKITHIVLFSCMQGLEVMMR